MLCSGPRPAIAVFTAPTERWRVHPFKRMAKAAVVHEFAQRTVTRQLLERLADGKTEELGR